MNTAVAGATISGGCMCGAVRYAFAPPVTRSVFCHCRSCQRHTGAPVAAFVGMRDGAWRWTGKPAKPFASSPGVERTFCPECGTSLSFRSSAVSFSGQMHFLAATLDDPAAFPPESHYFCVEARPWAAVDDGLIRYEGNGA